MHHVKQHAVNGPRWLKRLARFSNPGRVVNVCFFVVFLFATLLTWREVLELEASYIFNQRNILGSVSHEIDSEIQTSTNQLIFYRNGMQAALNSPLRAPSLHEADEAYQQKRGQHEWSIYLNRHRVLPIYGVADDFVKRTPGLSRENPRPDNELYATLEGGYLLRLADLPESAVQQLSYVSRAGFFLSSESGLQPQQITERYRTLINTPWFNSQNPRRNASRGLLWSSWVADSPMGPVRRVAASIPVDFEHYWYGVLAMEFSLPQMEQLLTNAAESEPEGEYRLYDSNMNLIAASVPKDVRAEPLSPAVKASLLKAFKGDTRGGERLATRYVSWEKLRTFDGVLLRIHHLKEGLRGDFGKVSIVLFVLWVMFTALLIVSWTVIRRMVRNMSRLQASLEWQAWYDGLTSLYNRNKLFALADRAAADCKELDQPLAMIQLDLDHFKQINDQYGHQAGDKVLSQTAAMVMDKTRGDDLCGRVGGEEFCIILPGATLENACAIAERIRARINCRDILIGKKTTLRVSASLGVSCSEENSSYDIEYLQSVADKRLYLAKQSGRNRVVCSDNV